MPKGGARKGAGRKPVPYPKKNYQIGAVLSKSCYDWVIKEAKRQNISRSRLIEKLIQKEMNS